MASDDVSISRIGTMVFAAIVVGGVIYASAHPVYRVLLMNLLFWGSLLAGLVVVLFILASVRMSGHKSRAEEQRVGAFQSKS
ncbi:MAG TPA: hypothetical protein VGQ87_03060 [Patescibacteria group bacterium]|nr:hypothetical protein [Patescibacteria group bacterium]